jgi:hypothetical protein
LLNQVKMTDSNSPKIEPLTSENYSTWSVRMRALLEHKDLWEVTAHGIRADADALLQKKNRQARAIIILHVSDALLVTAAAHDSARHLWHAYQMTYQAKSTARRQQLRRSLTGLHKKPEESLTTYFDRACKIRDDLQGIGHPVDEDTVVGALLSGLPESYDTAVAILESSLEELKIDDVFSKLLLTEQRHETHGSNDAGDTALMTKAKAPKSLKMSDAKRKALRCWRCGKLGHKRAECRVKLGRSDEAFTSFALMANAEAIHENKWIMDSGASQHMAWDGNAFATYRPLPEFGVSACDGKKVLACGVGDVRLKTVIGDRVNDVILKDVLHVPNLMINLVSAGRADNGGGAH